MSERQQSFDGLAGRTFEVVWGALVGEELFAYARVLDEHQSGWLYVQPVQEGGAAVGDAVWLSPAAVCFLRPHRLSEVAR
jgi:hypothetical protein